ncbi:MAG: hypothetical protein ABDH91_04825 [Bacteroidia bacterium]
MKGWVRLTACPNGLWAALLRSFLEAHGVPVYVENEAMHTLFGAGLPSQWLPSPILGGLYLWVPAAYQAQATTYLHEFFNR